MYRLYFSFILILFTILPFSADASVLSPDQTTWLSKHNNTIIVRPEKNYPPFSFISSSTSLRPKGMAVDYLDLVAKKVGAQVAYLDAKTRNNILTDLKSGKEGVALALYEDRDSDNDFYFSEPFVTLPAVIVTRKDFKKGDRELTLSDFNAKQIAVTEGYAVADYIKDNYQRIIIDPVSDDEVALQKLLLGEVDAAVMDLASLSYYTSRDMLSYVSVAGQTGFDYRLSFAVPKSMPELINILNSGLKEITPAEKTIVSDRWITFDTNNSQKDIYKKTISILGTPVWMVVSILAIVIIAILLTIMFVHSRRHHALHVAVLNRGRAKEKKLTELTEELKTLESSSDILNENMQEIKILEKEIQEKIQHIND